MTAIHPLLPTGCSISKKIKFYSSFDIQHIGENNYTASSNDPSLLFKLPHGENGLVISMQIYSSKPECLSALYFSSDKERQFSEANKIIFGEANGQEFEKHLFFTEPIYWLRIDPVDNAGDFTIAKIDIRVAEENIEHENNRIKIYHELSAQDNFQRLRREVESQSWNRDNVFVFVTHEISGTGAPLLCRKMSAMAKRLGMNTVILSLSKCYDGQIIRQFYDDCDELFFCDQNEELSYLSKNLSGIGFKYSILNSVATGPALHHFKNAGFKTICLIHEMYSALKILQSQTYIEDYSLYADKVVFPADCVRDEFIDFGGAVFEKSTIISQGFYKESNLEADDTFRSKTLKKLNIPSDAKLIIGAGSINFRKGLDLLPLIACELKRLSSSDYHFIWLGKSDEEQYNEGVKSQILRMNLSDKFHFIGYISKEDEYKKYFSICDAFAMVSREDPYPSVIIESMVYGVPVVAFTGSGGAQDLLADGRGYLVDYMDITQYSKVIDSICQIPGFADDVKARAKDYINRQANFKEYVGKILTLCTQ